MKRIGVLVFTFLVITSAIHAQGFDFGFKGGYLYSDIKDKSVKGLKTEGNSGYFLGAFARVNGESWFFQPELQYRVRSSDVSFTDIIKNNVEVKLKTLDIPLQVGYYVLDLPMVRLALHAGPTISFKVADDTTIKNEVKDFDLNKFTDYKSFIWSGQIGVSADISRFNVGIAYEKGFSDVAEDGLGKNDLLLVNIGIKF